MSTTRDQHFASFNYTGQRSGPRLIITGAVHGNEICGTEAIRRVLAELAAGTLRIAAGSVTLVPVTNALAYALGQRAGDRNLNRRLFPTAHPHDFEDHVANWLCPLLASHEVLLDLHSFHAAGTPFVMLGPRNNTGPLQPFQHEVAERALARRLGATRFVEGWLATHAAGVRRRMHGHDAAALELALRHGVGTTEYMRACGGYALTLECGQHADPAAIDVAYAAIRNTLAFLGLIDAPVPAPVTATAALSMLAVVDRIDDGDIFSLPWRSFDPVRAGQEIGRRGDGTAVLATANGCILFPDSAAAPGQEWFYLTEIMPNL